MRELRLLLVLVVLLTIGGAAAQSAGSSLAAGRSHSLAIGGDGSIWSFGNGDDRRLGRVTSDKSNTPARANAPFGTRFVSVAGGFEHSLAIDGAGLLWSWGNNVWGTLGHPRELVHFIATPTPIPVVGTEVEGVAFVQIAAGRRTSLALDTSGRLWGWGGTTARGRSFVEADSLHQIKPVEFPEPVRVVSFSVSWGHGAALDDQGHIWMWGTNNFGELGIGPAGENGLYESTFTPRRVVHPNGRAFISVATTIAFTAAVDEEGVGWTWGEQKFGSLGTGQPDSAPLPTHVAMPYGVRFVTVALGEMHAIALDQSGNAWAWGWGNLGQLGTGVSWPQTTPMQVVMPPGVRFTAVTAGFSHSLAIDNSGRIWGWGANFNGELGLPLEEAGPLTPTLVGTF